MIYFLQSDAKTIRGGPGNGLVSECTDILIEIVSGKTMTLSVCGLANISYNFSLIKRKAVRWFYGISQPIESPIKLDVPVLLENLAANDANIEPSSQSEEISSQYALDYTFYAKKALTLTTLLANIIPYNCHFFYTDTIFGE